jgi:hypothetical protein
MQANLKTGKLNKNEVGTAYRMTRQEQDISFMNNYFIYKKVRSVDIKDVKIGLIPKSPQQEEEEVRNSIQAQNAVISTYETMTPLVTNSIPKLRKKKIMLGKPSK